MNHFLKKIDEIDLGGVIFNPEADEIKNITNYTSDMSTEYCYGKKDFNDRKFATSDWISLKILNLIFFKMTSLLII